MFTYHNKYQLIHSRIDRIYLPQNQKIKNVSIIPNNLSNHDAVTLTIKIKNANTYGQGYRKLNTSILKRKSFQKLFRKFWTDWRTQKNNYVSLNQWWESGKIYFKIIAIKFSTIKNEKMNRDLQNLTENILQEKMKYSLTKQKLKFGKIQLTILKTIKNKELSLGARKWQL